MISILMPVKNAVPYLRECIDSIIDQSEQNWELIAINDHSEDDSFGILKNYAASDSRIKIFNNSGKGIINALDKAFKLSVGKFVTRMDSDDIMAKDKLKLMQETFNKKHDHLCIGLVRYFAEDQLGQGYQNYEKWLNDLSRSENNYADIYKECVIPSPCWMMHREVFENIGGFKDSVYPEDYDLCFRMYQYNVPVKAVDEVLHFWRDHSDRASRNDENYKDNSFLSLKTKYFLEIDRKPKKPLILWGAGKKGKTLASLLLKRDVDFTWVCNNEKKIGKQIKGKELFSTEEVFNYPKTQIVIAVANPLEQEEIKKTMGKLREVETFWFC